MMQPRFRRKLTATPEGIFMEGKPLQKSDLSGFSRQSLLHLVCATALWKKMTPRDWERPSPPGPNGISRHALLEMNLAFAGLDTLEKFDFDEQRDARGRWTAGGLSGFISHLRSLLTGEGAAEAPASTGAAGQDQRLDTGTRSRKRFLTEREAEPIARAAQAFVDHKVPYISRYLADESGADCSGSTYYIYNHAGFPYSPRLSVAGFVEKIKGDTNGKGKDEHFPFAEIPPGSKPQIGDVIVFNGNGHMAIYAGKDNDGDAFDVDRINKMKAYVVQKIKIFQNKKEFTSCGCLLSLSNK